MRPLAAFTVVCVALVVLGLLVFALIRAAYLPNSAGVPAFLLLAGTAIGGLGIAALVLRAFGRADAGRTRNHRERQPRAERPTASPPGR